MDVMRGRGAEIIAVWVIVAVVVSAAMTCVPGAMQMQASQMTSCANMADMENDQACVSSGVAMDCCAHHEPSLTAAKADCLKTPLQHVSPWLAWIAPVMIAPMTRSIMTAESPPELTSTLGPPTYIVLSALRV
jgi:hypothetical protein